GLRDVAGKRPGELAPPVEDYWIEALARVADTGRPESLEGWSEGVQAWFEAHLAPYGPPGGPLVAVAFQNVTERKRAEAALRESEALQAYLVRLSDALRRAADPAVVLAEACRLLRAELKASRVQFSEFEPDRGMLVVRAENLRDGQVPVWPEHRLEDFGEHATRSMLEGQGLACRDTRELPGLQQGELEAWEALNIRALVSEPLVRAGAFAAVVSVNDDRPRDWTGPELTLIRETAERAWDALERARAERALDEERARFSAILAQLPAGVLVAEAATTRLSLVNEESRRLFGDALSVGTPLNAARLDGEGTLAAPLKLALNGSSTRAEEFDVDLSGSRRVLLASASPVLNLEGQPANAVLTLLDVTAQRLAEERARRLDARIRAAREALDEVRAPGPVTPERFVAALGEVFGKAGRPPLEGRMAALLLLSDGPVTLAEAARRLGVTKAAVSRIAQDMANRGDLKERRVYSTREHTYELTDSTYLRDLKVRRSQSWYVAMLCRQLLEDDLDLTDEAGENLRSQAVLHARVALAIGNLLEPFERRQERDLLHHLQHDWDAVQPLPGDDGGE
ncbi:MAG TPA: PAS domain-containing protein, partial [Deinococcales bacterium]|nr:PAS domain-containing protein [Deinococcales bacterium]